MRGAVLDLYQGMRPIAPYFGGSPLMNIREAHYWLWRVRVMHLEINIEATKDTDDGPEVIFEINASRNIVIPIGEGTTGSRTEADQLISRKGFVDGDTNDETGAGWLFGFATHLTQVTTNLFFIGLNFQVLLNGVVIVSGSNLGTGISNVNLQVEGLDFPLLSEYGHALTLFGSPNVSGTVSAFPVQFHEWIDPNTGLALYDSVTGALIP